MSTALPPRRGSSPDRDGSPPPPAATGAGVDGPDDFALMERIADGDRAALDLLYQRYSPVVFALCFRIVGDRGIAEDLLIDIFFELWRKADRYDASRGAPITYISTLARSRSIDKKRGKAARWTVAPEGTFESASEDGIRPDNSPNPYEQSVLTEQADKVREALNKLDPEHRKTLELSYYEGLSHSEIAAKLAKPLGTVKTHIRMGIIQLRELLRMDPEGTR